MNHAMTFVREEVGIAVLQSFSSTSPCSPSAHTRIKADEQKHPEKIGKESDFGHCRTCPMHGMHSMNSTILNSRHRRFQVFRQAVLVDIFHDDLTDLTHQRFLRETLNAVKNCLVWLWTFVMFIWALGCAANLQPCDEQWVLLHKVKRVTLMRRACLFTWDILITGPKNQSPCRKGVRTLHPLHNNSHQNCQECCDFLWGSANVGETTCIILFSGSKEEKVLGQPRVRLIPLLDEQPAIRMMKYYGILWNTVTFALFC